MIIALLVPPRPPPPSPHCAFPALPATTPSTRCSTTCWPMLRAWHGTPTLACGVPTHRNRRHCQTLLSMVLDRSLPTSLQLLR